MALGGTEREGLEDHSERFLVGVSAPGGGGGEPRGWCVPLTSYVLQTPLSMRTTGLIFCLLIMCLFFTVALCRYWFYADSSNS